VGVIHGARRKHCVSTGTFGTQIKPTPTSGAGLLRVWYPFIVYDDCNDPQLVDPISSLCDRFHLFFDGLRAHLDYILCVRNEPIFTPTRVNLRSQGRDGGGIGVDLHSGRDLRCRDGVHTSRLPSLIALRLLHRFQKNANCANDPHRLDRGV
jgi:hypothetical protein